MSSDNYLTVHQSEDVVFDDLTALHDELMKDYNTAELMDDGDGAPAGKTFIAQDASGTVTLYNRESDRHGQSTLVWGCWGDRVNKIVAKHLTSGKLVFKFDEEGHGESYYVITPGKVEQPKLQF